MLIDKNQHKSTCNTFIGCYGVIDKKEQKIGLDQVQLWIRCQSPIYIQWNIKK